MNYRFYKKNVIKKIMYIYFNEYDLRDNRYVCMYTYTNFK